MNAESATYIAIVRFEVSNGWIGKSGYVMARELFRFGTTVFGKYAPMSSGA